MFHHDTGNGSAILCSYVSWSNASGSVACDYVFEMSNKLMCEIKFLG